MNFAYSIAAIIVLAGAQLHPMSKSPKFRINANPPPDHQLSYIQGWNLSSYHIAAGSSRAVFHGNDSGRVFWVNGTDAEFAGRQATLNTDGGASPGWPWGVQVADATRADEEGRLPVWIAVARRSPGLQVADWPGTVYYETGAFYVCLVDLLYGPVPALYWHPKLAKTPTDCVNVELQAWCLNTDGGLQHPFGRNSTCYL